MLKDAALYWVRKNCRDLKLQSDFSDDLEKSMREGTDCWFGVGKDLTRHRVPYLLRCFAGELFVFQLRDDQTQAINLKPHAFLGRTAHQPAPHSSAASSPVISITRLTFDRELFTTSDDISGSCDYELCGEGLSSYCLRLDCSAFDGGDLIRWSCPDQILGATGQIRFVFDKLDIPSPFPFAVKRPLGLFLRVCAKPPDDDVLLSTPVSNISGTLLDYVL